jgi:hypothetical protein
VANDSCAFRNCAKGATVRLWFGNRLCQPVAYCDRHAGQVKEMFVVGREFPVGEPPKPKPKPLVAECRNGHPRTPQNTSRSKDGYLRCLVCHRAADARFWRRKARVAA